MRRNAAAREPVIPSERNESKEYAVAAPVNGVVDTA
jgi:hypothetical protein